jgi:hypothetical protein
MAFANIVIIRGANSLELRAASRVLAFFVRLGCPIVSSNFDGTTFLYTLANQEQFYYHEAKYLECLAETHVSNSFSVMIA